MYLLKHYECQYCHQRWRPHVPSLSVSAWHCPVLVNISVCLYFLFFGPCVCPPVSSKISTCPPCSSCSLIMIFKILHRRRIKCQRTRLLLECRIILVRSGQERSCYLFPCWCGKWSASWSVVVGKHSCPQFGGCNSSIDNHNNIIASSEWETQLKWITCWYPD